MDKAKTNALPERAGRRVELPSRWLSAAAKDLQKKFEGPRILSNRRAASDIEPVSRILSGIAAADGHSSGPRITARLKRPTRRFGAPSRHALAPRRFSPVTELTAPSGNSFPIWSCSVWGLPCPRITAAAVRSYRTFSPLPRRCAPRRYVFCGTFRQAALTPPSRTLSGTLLCGVRTFLPLDRAARETRRPRARQRPSGSTSAIHIIR